MLQANDVLSTLKVYIVGACDICFQIAVTGETNPRLTPRPYTAVIPAARRDADKLGRLIAGQGADPG